MRTKRIFNLVISLAFIPEFFQAGEAMSTSRPETQTASRPAEVYSAWPFDAKEAARRQDETSKALGIEKEITLDLGNKGTMKLILIPAGRFMMGSPKDEKGRETQHEVTITRPFYMGIYEVTQEQYEQVAGANPSKFKAANKPVDSVSWNDGTAFCKKLSAKSGKAVSLPTEAQWEYACRAGSQGRFYPGDDVKQLADYAVFAQAWPNGGTAAVGSKKPNAWGLYDMHGNVWEWCADFFNATYEGVKEQETDPTGPVKGETRVLRGGGWYNNSGMYCRSAIHYGHGPNATIDFTGFRVAVELK